MMKSRLNGIAGAAVAAFLAPLALAAAHVYPVPPGEERHAAGYAVEVDGEEVPVLAVRHSAMPVNCRWPGHQRDLDQTEIGGLVRFAFMGTASVRVTAPRDFKEVKVRPQSKGAKVMREGRTVTVEIAEYGGYSVEFDGIHSNLLVFADRPLAFDVRKGEENVRYFGPGEHEAGLIEMRPGETLYLDEGAIVYGRIHAKDADNIRILGRGILDMSRIHAETVEIDPALEREQRAKGFALTNERRYDAVKIEYCDNVLIDGITIRDSLLYTIRPICCRGITVRNVGICGNWRYNSDGIDLHNCENVRIADCFVRAFDDVICIKGFDYRMDEREMLHEGYRHDVFTNVVVEGCTVWADWGHALEFGAETRAREIANVTFRNCDVVRTHSSVCDIFNCDYADIHDIRFEDIRIEEDAPHYETCLSESRTKSGYTRKVLPNHAPEAFAATITMIPEYSKNEAKRGRNRRITVKDIRVTGGPLPRLRVNGYDAAHRTEDIVIDGIWWNGREVSREVEARQQVGPTAEKPLYLRGAGGPLAAAERWFARKGAEIIAQARRTMDDGTVVYAPQAGDWYKATWLRDYVMMLEGGLVPTQHLAGAASVFLKAAGPEGEGLDCVMFDGKVMRQPGYGTCGKNTVLDGYPYLVSLVYETWRQTGDDRWIGRETLDLLAKALARMPHREGLPWIDPAQDYDRAPWGFTDSTKKTGNELFCSLLEIRARRELGRMLAAAKRHAEGEREEARARELSERVNRVFWDEQAGLYLAATAACRQGDIWGSAYAVWLGVADEPKAEKIAATFARDFDGLVQNGQVRHLRPGEFWQAHNRFGPPGEYQNGYYWGTPVGWFCWTLERSHPALVDRIYADLLTDYRKRGPYERTFGNRAYCADYLASLALPLQGLRRLIANRKETRQ